MKIYSIKNCLNIIAFRNKYDILTNKFVKVIINNIINKIYNFSIRENNIYISCDIYLSENKTRSLNE